MGTIWGGPDHGERHGHDPPPPRGGRDGISSDTPEVPGKLVLRDVSRRRDMAPWMAFGVGSLGIGAVLIAHSPELQAWQRLGGGVLTVAYAGFFFFVAYRFPRTGIEADELELRVTNQYRTYHVRWEQLRDIGFRGVNNEDGHTVYHRLVLNTHSKRIVAFAPEGSPDPGGRLDTARRTLLDMRDQFTGRAPETSLGPAGADAIAGSPSPGMPPHHR